MPQTTAGFPGFAYVLLFIAWFAPVDTFTNKLKSVNLSPSTAHVECLLIVLDRSAWSSVYLP